MKNLRNCFLIAAGAMFLVGTPLIQAQSKPAKPDAGERGGGPGDRLKMMKEELELTPAQVEQIRPLVQAEMRAMRAVRDDAALDGKAKREKVREMRQSNRASIAAILTPAQRAKLDAMPKRGPGGPGKKPE